MSSGTLQLSRSLGSNRLSSLVSGCSELLQSQSSPAGISGDWTSNPDRSGDDCRLPGSVTKAPLAVSSTPPQLSSAYDSPTLMMVVHELSVVFMLIATLTMHEAPTTLLPHEHW